MESRPPLRRHALQALTSAALALPGVAVLPVHAQAPSPDAAAVLQFGRYHEDARNLDGPVSKFAPLSADSLQISGWGPLGARLAATLNYRQDSWSGATPIAIAPWEWRGNRPTAPDGVSGASPFIAPGGPLYLDKATLAPMRTDGFGNLTGGTDPRLVHTISGASMEVRRQVDGNLRYDRAESSFNLNAGVSSEPDYLSRFAGAGALFDFNAKQTSLNLGLTYASSDIHATLDHDATPYIYDACGTAACNFYSTSSEITDAAGGRRILSGSRRDVGASFGLTQIMSPDAQLNANLGYLESRGYLGNPYRVVEVAFVDPAQQIFAPSPDVYYITVNALLEQRPDVRRQWTWNLRYAQFVPSVEAGAHLNYAYYRDDWGIKAHTLQAEWAQPLPQGWLVTPMLRYYTQTAASFYTPYLVTPQGQYSEARDPGTGRDRLVPFDRSLLPAYYSSDYRLAAFGAVSAGIGITKSLARGATFSLGYTYYQRASRLTLEGSGSGAFMDFDAHLVNASVQVALDGAGLAPPPDPHAGHAAMHGSAQEATVPAGVMFAHTLAAGDAMVSLRYAGSRSSGSLRRGTSQVDDARARAQACGTDACLAVPASMSMNMFMLELMYAPTDWLTLMAMPQYMDMTMSMRGLLTPAEEAALAPDALAIYQHHTLHDHSSAGLGDTGFYALATIPGTGAVHTVATLGVTAPTGDVGVRWRDTHQQAGGYADYGVQLGSGTWDLVAALTATGGEGDWTFGAQAAGTVRMQDRNASGYALGNVFQASAWAGRALGAGWSASLRGLYTWQGAIEGGFEGTLRPLAPTDYAANYGGRFIDVGVGLGYRLPRAFARSRLDVEWLQPVHDDPNGYQLARRGTLFASWQYAF